MSTTSHQQLIVTLPNGDQLKLKDYIKILKGKVKRRSRKLSTITESNGDSQEDSVIDSDLAEEEDDDDKLEKTCSDIDENSSTSPSMPVPEIKIIKQKFEKVSSDQISPKNCKIKSIRPKSKPIRTPEEDRQYQARLNRLRAKIAEREYEGMTKNITSKSATNPHLHTALKEVGSVSRIAYSYLTISVSVLVSILSFFFMPIYLLPKASFPLGLRVGIGFVAATLVLIIEIYFYAKAYMGEHLSKESSQSPLVDPRIYDGSYKCDKIKKSKEKVDEWQKKTN